MRRDIDLARRALLRRIGFGAGMAYVAPGIIGFDVARASGASGGSSGGSPASGPSRGDDPGSSSRPSVPQASAPRTQPRSAPRQARPDAPPEIIAIVDASQSLDRALAQGYAILSESANSALSARIMRLGLPRGRTLPDALAELAQLLPGAVADQNHLYTPDEFLCDGADCAAQAMIGWSGWPSAMRPRIGMIDTGINVDHPSLRGQNLKVFQLDLDDRVAASRQHGTAIAAMLLGTVEGRVPGLLPNAKLVAVEAFHSGAAGDQADAFSLVGAFDILLGEGVDVINMSFSGPPNVLLERMVARAAELGIGMVAAAGNGGPGAEPAYPAAWPQVIAVTAVDSGGQAYRQANQGPYVMLAAPGVNIWTAASISGGRLRSGTSYAAPFVTAALAVERLRAPAIARDDVTKMLFACARDLGDAGYDPVYGHGLVSAPGTCDDDEQKFLTSGE